MKKSILFIALFIGASVISVSAQETIWFDANWNPTEKEKAMYYRPTPKTQKDGFWIVDYYMNGVKQMEGFSLVNTPNKEKFDGLVKYYFENGIIFQEVNFKEGKIDGERKIYFESGKLKSKREYQNDKVEGKFSEFYESGELHVIGNYQDGLKEGNWKVFYKNGKIKEKGKYENGEKIGIWKTFYKNVYKK